MEKSSHHIFSSNPSPKTPIIRVENIVKRFPGAVALDNVSVILRGDYSRDPRREWFR